ncbi:MAG: hypothetical protein J5829_02615 [Lachnospiraceae bacterium]|nr:hypothetical protein [Lachnospiraceae bacterium]
MKNRYDLKKSIVLLLTLCLLAGNLYQVYGTEDMPPVSVSEKEAEENGQGTVSENGTEDETPTDRISDNDAEEDDARTVSDDMITVSDEEASGTAGDVYGTGYIPVEMDVPDTYYPEGCEDPAGSLESVYLPNINTEITSVKNQGQEGICWAYSASAVLEQSAIKTGLGDLSTNYNEDQLEDAFVSSHRNDPLNLTAGDKVVKGAGGNNNIFTTWLLASQVAPVLQSKARTSGYADRAASLVEAKIIPSDDLTAIKQAIKDYGAVTIGIDATNYNGFASDKLTYGYRAKYHYNEDHAVCLIGWDDTLDKSNFGDKTGNAFSSASFNSCPINGGFKFKNSWGSDVGDNGYQYISYADNAFSGSGRYAIAYKIDRADSFETVYEYDGSYGRWTSTVTRAANIYTAQANDSANGAEIVDRVGFAVFDTGEYTVSLYVNNHNDALTDATSGQWFMDEDNIIASKNVTVQNSGYYTTVFDNDPTVEEGKEFAVVLKRTDGTRFSIFSDQSYDNNGWIQFIIDTSNEKTFAQNGSNHLDTTVFTPRLKAFTRNTSTVAPVATDLSTANISLKKPKYNYTGAQIRPMVTVKDKNGTVVPMTGNYTLEYGDNLNVGTGRGTVLVKHTAGGICTGSRTLTFDIEPAYLGDTTSWTYNNGKLVEKDIESFAWLFSPFYRKKDVAKYYQLSLNGNYLVEGTDYYVDDPDTVVDSTENQHIDLIGMGNFTGSRYGLARSNGNRIDLNARKYSTLPDGSQVYNIVNDSEVEVEYTGELPVISDLKLWHTTRGALVPGKDYKIINNNTTVKDANSSFTVTASGNGVYSGTKDVLVYIDYASVSQCQVSGVTNKTYTGAAITQDDLVVKVNGKTLEKGTDYKLEYSENINAGNNAKVKIKGTGNYKDEKIVNFSINKATPVLSNLTATDIVSGQRIKDSIISGTAKNGSVKVPGSFAFNLPMTAPPVGTARYAVMFTPEDENNYEKAYGEVSVTVNERDVTIAVPGVDDQTYKAGRTLSDITINNPVGNPAGSWRWKEPQKLLTVPGGNYKAVFTYEDRSKPDKEFNITVRVNKASVTLTDLSATAIRYGQWLYSSLVTGTAKSGDDDVPGTFRFMDPSIEPSLSDSDSTLYEVVFTPEDTDDYLTASGNVMIHVNKADSYVMDPVVPDVTYRQGLALSDITLINPSGNMDGTWRWNDPSTLLSVPGGYYPATFTPDDTNFNNRETYIDVVVIKANAVIPDSAQNTLDAMTLPKGKSLSDITDRLPAGFRWGSDEDTAKRYDDVGQKINARVVYNPDPANYNDVTGTAHITIVEASDDEENEEPPEKEEFDGKIKSLAIVNSERKKIKSLKLAKGDVYYLDAAVVTSTGEVPEYHFRSNNTRVVRVTDDGKVTGFGQGTATITVYCGNKTASCSVSVTEEIEKVSLFRQKDRIKVGEKLVVMANVEPYTSAADRTISWSVDNKKLASATGSVQGCVLTAKKAGSVTLTAKIKTKDAGGKTLTMVENCQVQIDDPNLEPVSSPDKSYKLGFRKASVKITGLGNTGTVTAVLSKSEKAESVSVDWISSNEDVIKIREAESSAYPSGKNAIATATVSACGAGSAYLIAKVTDNETGLTNVNRCKVTVNVPIQLMFISKDSLGLLNGDTIGQLRKGQKDTLFVDIFPESPTNINKVTWSAKGGVKVKNGVVQAVKVTKGLSTVTVRCGNVRHTIYINVTK